MSTSFDHRLLRATVSLTVGLCAGLLSASLWSWIAPERPLAGPLWLVLLALFTVGLVVLAVVHFGAGHGSGRDDASRGSLDELDRLRRAGAI